MRIRSAWVQPWPRAVVESVSRGGDGGVDILGAGRLDVADRLFGVRGDDRELLRVDGLAPLASDEKLVVGTVVRVLGHRGTYLWRGKATVTSLLMLT